MADLVTQAPPDDAHSSAAQKEETRPRRCTCLRRSSELKLAAVHPVVAEALPPSAAQLAAQVGQARQEPDPRPRQPVEPPPASAPAAPLQAATTLASADPPAAASPPAAGAAAPEPRQLADVVQQEGQLGPQAGPNIGRKTLVLDLDETLVHSSFRIVHSADIVITVELDGEHHKVYVRKRPGVDNFLTQVAQLYEVVVYTASVAKYADPLLDMLDKERLVSWRLYREACTRQPTGYIKDLSRLGRSLKDVIIIDNSPMCYALQPNNAIPIRTWREDPADRELLDLIPILYSLAIVEDIPMVLKQIVWSPDD